MKKSVLFSKPTILVIMVAIIAGVLLSTFAIPTLAKTEEPPVVEFEIPDEDFTILDIFSWTKPMPGLWGTRVRPRILSP